MQLYSPLSLAIVAKSLFLVQVVVLRKLLRCATDRLRLLCPYYTGHYQLWTFPLKLKFQVVTVQYVLQFSRKYRTRTHTHTHTLTHTHSHTHAHARTHARARARTHTHTHSGTNAHTFTHAHTHAHAHSHSHTLTYTHTHTHSHSRTHTLTHTHTHTLTHTRTHTHTHTFLLLFVCRLDNAMAQANCRHLNAEDRTQYQLLPFGECGGKVALALDFLPVLLSPQSVSFHQCSHTHLFIHPSPTMYQLSTQSCQQSKPIYILIYLA